MEERRTVTIYDVDGKAALDVERIPTVDGLCVRVTNKRVRRPLIPLSEFVLAARALDPTGDSSE